MKRKILEITEIDCGDETCDGCDLIEMEYLYPGVIRCEKFGVLAPIGTTPLRRLPECLKAERAYRNQCKGTYADKPFDPMQTICPRPKGGFGPPDSIGE